MSRPNSLLSAVLFFSKLMPCALEAHYSQIVREQVKCKKPNVFRMPKQNQPQNTKHKTNTTRKKTSRKQSKNNEILGALSTSSQRREINLEASTHKPFFTFLLHAARCQAGLRRDNGWTTIKPLSTPQSIISRLRPCAT